MGYNKTTMSCRIYTAVGSIIFLDNFEIRNVRFTVTAHFKDSNCTVLYVTEITLWSCRSSQSNEEGL